MANTSSSARDRDVAYIVKMLLTDRGLKQNDLAEVLRLDSGGLSRALGGKRKWTIDDLESLAAFFDVPFTYLLEQPSAVFRSRCDWTEPQVAVTERELVASGT
jgi:transcriptional regulator with XRE-family HTH domain